MQRINHPSAPNGRWVAKDPNVAGSGTVITKDWLQGFEDELVNAVESVGLTLDPADFAQLAKAIQANFSLTRAELIAKRDAGKLKKGAVYKVTDRSFGTLGAVSINVTALANNKLSTWAELETAFAGAIFYGIYSLGTATVADEINYVADDRGNKVTGAANVKVFPWGNANILDVVIADAASTLTYTSGTMHRVRLEQGGKLTMSGGTLTDSTIRVAGVLTLKANHSWGLGIAQSTVEQRGIGYMRDVVVDNGSLYVGGVDFTNVRIKGFAFDTTGSVGSVTNSVFNDAYTANLANIPQLNINKVGLSSQAYVSANGAKSLIFNRSAFESNGWLAVDAGAEADITLCKAETGGYFSAQSTGKLIASYSTVNTGGLIYNANAGTNYVHQSKSSGASLIGFGANTDNTKIYYCTVEATGCVIADAAKNGVIQQCTAAGLADVRINNSTGAQILHSAARSQGNILITDCPAPVTIYGSVADSNAAAIQVLRATAAGRILGCAVSAVGQLNVADSTGNNWSLNYCSATAYHQVNAKFTAGNQVVQMIHGYGYGGHQINMTTAGQSITGANVKNF